MEIRARKETVRRLVLARRMRLADGDRADAGQRIAARARALPEIAGARRILAFASVRSEVPTEPLVRWVLDTGRVLLLPYVAGPGRMLAAPVAAVEQLAPGAYGIPEPREPDPVPTGDADVVLVPGVAFDVHGNRLGYGGGFYDRFLASVPGHIPRVGLAFEIQIVDTVPVEDRDERVDILVTEDRVVRPGE